jgi:hypothetical protein
MNTYTKSNRENTVFRYTRHYGSALYSSVVESLGRIVKRIVQRGARQIRLLYKIHSHKETNSVMVATGYNFSRSGQVLIGEYHT